MYIYYSNSLSHLARGGLTRHTAEQSLLVVGFRHQILYDVLQYVARADQVRFTQIDIVRHDVAAVIGRLFPRDVNRVGGGTGAQRRDDGGAAGRGEALRDGAVGAGAGAVDGLHAEAVLAGRLQRAHLVRQQRAAVHLQHAKYTLAS